MVTVDVVTSVVAALVVSLATVAGVGGGEPMVPPGVDMRAAEPLVDAAPTSM